MPKVNLGSLKSDEDTGSQEEVLVFLDATVP